MPHLSQIDLITAISRHLEQNGCKNFVPRQFNAIIQAADLIVNAFKQEYQPAQPNRGLEAWSRSDDTGQSSKAMAHHLAPMAGLDTYHVNEPKARPYDSADFGRCVRLLDAVPELRRHLLRMAEVSPQWAALVENWEELENLYRKALSSRNAPQLSRRMRELMEPLNAKS